MPAPIRIPTRAADDFARAMQAERGAPAPVPTLRPASPARAALPPGSLSLGEAETGGEVGLDLARLFDGRLLIQGVSGAGKSWTLRRLIEQTRSQVQQILIDPEGEFADLGRALDFVEIDASALDIAGVALAAARVREHRLSVRLDLSHCERDRQMQQFTAFARALIEAPREHWSPVLVAIDEAHVLAPFGGGESHHTKRASVAALTDLMSRGRKRGLAGVLATQRLAKLAKSVASEASNFLIGRNSLDLDIARAAETIGWARAKASDRLPLLEPGDFVAIGPAFSRSPVILRVGAIETRHEGASPAILAAPRLDATQAKTLLDIDALIAAADEPLAAPGLPTGARALRAFLREPQAALAARAFAALAEIAPQGARLTEMEAHFTVSGEALSQALALLDAVGLIEFGDGAARLTKGALK